MYKSNQMEYRYMVYNIKIEKVSVGPGGSSKEERLNGMTFITMRLWYCDLRRTSERIEKRNDTRFWISL